MSFLQWEIGLFGWKMKLENNKGTCNGFCEQSGSPSFYGSGVQPRENIKKE